METKIVPKSVERKNTKKGKPFLVIQAKNNKTFSMFGKKDDLTEVANKLKPLIESDVDRLVKIDYVVNETNGKEFKNIAGIEIPEDVKPDEYEVIQEEMDKENLEKEFDEYQKKELKKAIELVEEVKDAEVEKYVVALFTGRTSPKHYWKQNKKRGN